MTPEIRKWFKPGAVVPIEPSTISALMAEVVRLDSTNKRLRDALGSVASYAQTAAVEI